jgi:hypothetical protein
LAKAIIVCFCTENIADFNNLLLALASRLLALAELCHLRQRGVQGHLAVHRLGVLLLLELFALLELEHRLGLGECVRLLLALALLECGGRRQPLGLVGDRLLFD